MVIWHFFCHVLLCSSSSPFQRLCSMEIHSSAPAKVEHPWLLGLVCLLCPSMGTQGTGTPLPGTNKLSVGSLFGVTVRRVENMPVMTPRNVQETLRNEALSWGQGASIMIHSLGLSASPACPETKAFAKKLWWLQRQTRIEISSSFCFPSGAAEQPLRADKAYPPFPHGAQLMSSYLGLMNGRLKTPGSLALLIS